MSWVDGYVFPEEFEDLRAADESPEAFDAELRRELAEGHPLHNVSWTVIARAWPQDDIVVRTPTGVAVVHLTWSQRSESPPRPATHPMTSVEDFELFVENTYR